MVTPFYKVWQQKLQIAYCYAARPKFTVYHAEGFWVPRQTCAVIIRARVTDTWKRDGVLCFIMAFRP